jgi:Domain of unknown function (DUF4105)
VATNNYFYQNKPLVKKLLPILLFFISLFSLAQTNSSKSCDIQISLLTCTPGEELYSTFGHSAFRVIDSSTNTDIVFNYGTFDFYDPDFYEKFVKGKLLYFVAIDSLESFLQEYEYFKRGVTEQVLNLSCSEKQNMLAALYENAKEEKYYRYDFNYDNCTTRLRDILEEITRQKLQTKNILPHSNTTFRNLIHVYLDRGGQQWSKLGIDILLGSPLDKKVTNSEAMFLPDYLMMAFDSATYKSNPLVSEKKILINAFENPKSNSLFNPLTVFIVFFLLVATLSFLKNDKWKRFFTFFDSLFFLILGLLGVLLVFMWAATDHAMCKNNSNLLWALPTHLPIAFMLFTKKEWIKKYFSIVFFLTLILLLIWFFLPQQLNTALLPITGIILIRSYFRKNNK